MTKILFLIPTLGHGGAERVLVNLVNHMDKQAYQITVQTLFDTGLYREQLSPDVRYIPGWKHYFRGNTVLMKLFTPSWLYRHLIKEKYDVVVSYLEGSSARIVAGCPDPGTKLVSWIHIEQHTAKWASASFRSYGEAVACYNKFHRIVAVAKTVKDDFERIMKPERPLEVVYNTIESEKILERAKESVTDIELRHDRINLCSVAKLMKTKGYDRLIRVLGRLREKGVAAHLYLIGSGEEEAALKKLAHDAGLDEDCTFLGFRENPYKYVAACDLYVCSSRKEGFSTSVTEALILGTPVVSTDCSGARELLGEHNEFGVVTANDEDALFEGVYSVLSDPSLLPEYKKKAEQRGGQFETAERVRQAETLFDEVMRS